MVVGFRNLNFELDIFIYFLDSRSLFFILIFLDCRWVFLFLVVIGFGLWEVLVGIRSVEESEVGIYFFGFVFLLGYYGLVEFFIRSYSF